MHFETDSAPSTPRRQPSPPAAVVAPTTAHDMSVCLDIAEDAARTSSTVANPYMHMEMVHIDAHIKALTDVIAEFNVRLPSSLSYLENQLFSEAKQNLRSALAASMLASVRPPTQQPTRPSTTYNMLSYMSDDRVYAASVQGAPLPPYGLVCASNRFNSSTQQMETVIVNRALDQIPPVFWPLPTDVANVFDRGLREGYIRVPYEIARHILHDLRTNPHATDDDLFQSVWTDPKLQPTANCEFSLYAMTCSAIAAMRAVQTCTVIRPYPPRTPGQGCRDPAVLAAVAAQTKPAAPATKGRGRGKKLAKSTVTAPKIKEEIADSPIVIQGDSNPEEIETDPVELRRERQRGASQRYRLRKKLDTKPRVMNIRMMQIPPDTVDSKLLNPTVNLIPVDADRATLDVNMNNIQSLERMMEIDRQENELLYGTPVDDSAVDYAAPMNLDLD
jgi:hypothetical protein